MNVSSKECSMGSGVKHILVGIDDGSEVDRAILNSLFQDRSNSSCFHISTLVVHHETSMNLLGRVCRINDDGVLGLVVHNKIGVVVRTTNPCAPLP